MKYICIFILTIVTSSILRCQNVECAVAKKSIKIYKPKNSTFNFVNHKLIKCDEPIDSLSIKYLNSNGFCSSTIILNSNNIFFYEAGCEGRSTIEVGSWGKIGDTLHLQQLESGLNFDPIKRITSIKNNSDTLKISIYDINGKNVTESQPLKLILSNTDSIVFLSWNEIIETNYIFKNENQKVFLGNGEYQILDYKVDKIQIQKIIDIFHKNYEVTIKNKNEVKIYLNLPQELLWPNDAKRLNSDYSFPKFIVKEDGLYNQSKRIYKKITTWNKR